jgi:phage baseplate assembly protein W
MTSAQPLLGWPLLPLPDDGGQISWPTLEQSVAQQIRVILQTRPGEQLMRPAFGAGLENFLHESNTITTHRRIRDLVSASLSRWEQRIVVDDVAVFAPAGKADQVRVEIAYRLRRTGAASRVGLTLDLGV